VRVLLHLRREAAEGAAAGAPAVPATAPASSAAAAALPHALAVEPDALAALIASVVAAKQPWTLARILTAIPLREAPAADAGAPAAVPAHAVTSSPIAVPATLVAPAIAAANRFRLSATVATKHDALISVAVSSWLRRVIADPFASRSPSTATATLTRLLAGARRASVAAAAAAAAAGAPPPPAAPPSTYAQLGPPRLLAGGLRAIRILPTPIAAARLDCRVNWGSDALDADRAAVTAAAAAAAAGEGEGSAAAATAPAPTPPARAGEARSVFGDPLLILPPEPTPNAPAAAIGALAPPLSVAAALPPAAVAALLRDAASDAALRPALVPLCRELLRLGAWLTPAATAVVAEVAEREPTFLLPLLMHVQAQAAVLLGTVPGLPTPALLP
jgi:hypothetical protein